MGSTHMLLPRRCILSIIVLFNFVALHVKSKDVPFGKIVSFLENERKDIIDVESVLESYKNIQDEKAADLMLEARKKGWAANKIRELIRDVLAAMIRRGGSTKKEFETQININQAQANLLDMESQLLTEKATRIENNLKELIASPDKKNTFIHYCDILKVGPLNVATRIDDVNNSIKRGLVGKLNGQELTIYANKMPFLNFLLLDVVVPIKSIEEAPMCFGFKYRGSEIVLCAETKSSAHSWINAVTEAWFCVNKGIQGTLVGPYKRVEQSDANNEENKPKGVVNIHVYMDKNHKPHVIVNGKEHSSGSTIDVAKLINDNRALLREH